MYDYSRLMYRMKTKHITQNDLAKRVHMTPSTLSLKLHGKSNFNQFEIKDICDALEIDYELIHEYFFCREL